MLNKTPHSLNMFNTTTSKVNIVSCTLFDTQWLTNEFNLPFDNNDKSKDKMIGYVNKYRSYAVHWHNKWNNLNTLQNSWMYMMYNKLMYNKLMDDVFVKKV